MEVLSTEEKIRGLSESLNDLKKKNEEVMEKLCPYLEIFKEEIQNDLCEQSKKMEDFVGFFNFLMGSGGENVKEFSNFLERKKIVNYLNINKEYWNYESNALIPTEKIYNLGDSNFIKSMWSREVGSGFKKIDVLVQILNKMIKERLKNSFEKIDRKKKTKFVIKTNRPETSEHSQIAQLLTRIGTFSLSNENAILFCKSLGLEMIKKNSNLTIYCDLLLPEEKKEENENKKKGEDENENKKEKENDRKKKKKERVSTKEKGNKEKKRKRNDNKKGEKKKRKKENKGNSENNKIKNQNKKSNEKENINESNNEKENINEEKDWIKNNEIKKEAKNELENEIKNEMGK